MSGSRIREIEAKTLRKLRHPSRGTKIKDYVKNSGISTYDTELEQEANQIVDGVRIERYNPNEKNVKETTPKVQNDSLEEDTESLKNVDNIQEAENSFEAENSVETEPEETKGYIELYEEMEQKDVEQTYLDEVTHLLSELEGLDTMLKQTSIEIKNEKEKRKRNAELKAKMKKIKGIIQK